MYVYTGKVNFSTYSTDEQFTLVLADSVNYKDGCAAYWQWTVDASGVKNVNKECISTISESTCNSTGSKIAFGNGQMYFFTAEFAPDNKSGTAIMSDGAIKSSPIALALSFQKE